MHSSLTLLRCPSKSEHHLPPPRRGRTEVGVIMKEEGGRMKKRQEL